MWKRPATKSGCVEQPREERHRRLDAGDEIFAERAAHPRDRARPILGPRDQLRDHRIVEDRHVEARGGAAVVANARVRPARAAAGCGPATAGNCCPDPRRRCGIRSRGRAARAARSGSRSSRSPRAMRICQRTRSTPGHHLGDRMLDLQPRVHLEEIEAAVLVEQELDRAGVGVADRPGDRRGRRGHRAAQRRRRPPATAISSTTFWWRRWIEHSRSTNGSTVPWCRRAAALRCGAAAIRRRSR